MIKRYLKLLQFMLSSQELHIITHTDIESQELHITTHCTINTQCNKDIVNVNPHTLYTKIKK